jgi:hypothetical protein
VVNWGYPSTRDSVGGHAARLDRDLTPALRQSSGRVHFVTHSLGGIVLRRYLAHATLPNLGRIVMLAPPNQGSEVADRLQHLWVFRRATGPAGAELTTGSGGPGTLPEVEAEVGIVAGTRANNPLFSRWIAAPNDGKVAVERTKLPSMAGFLEVDHGHTFLAWHRDVIRQVFRFLETGAFAAAP